MTTTYRPTIVHVILSEQSRIVHRATAIVTSYRHGGRRVDYAATVDCGARIGTPTLLTGSPAVTCGRCRRIPTLSD